MLFDHLVGAGEDQRRDREAERVRGLEIDDEIEPDRLLDRQVGGARSLQDAIDIARGTARYIAEARCVGQKTTAFDVGSRPIDGWKAVLFSPPDSSVR